MSSSIPLILFVFAGLFTPGPNVVMLTASGARFGFRATLPHLLGVPIGTGILAATSAFGLNTILLAAPTLRFTFQIIAAIWILWLAWKTFRSGFIDKNNSTDKPFTFLQAIAFQAVNPKAWAITLAASASFGIGLEPHLEAMRLFLVFALINLTVCTFWTTMGHALARFLKNEKTWRAFTSIMSLFMASTVFLIFF